MRFRKNTICAAVVVAAALMPATALAEDSGGSVSVTPSDVGPGEEVDIRVDGCKGRTATGTSKAFQSDALFSTASNGGLFAEAKIRTDVEIKDYDIEVTCKDGGGKHGGKVHVVRRGSDEGDGNNSDGSGDSGTGNGIGNGIGSLPTPYAPVQAGGGGTFGTVEAAAEQEGPGTRHAVIGLALAAMAAVAVAARSARRRRRTD
ncbi:hypothetical protein GCM10020367_24310 [Streptomyces sannanensis]|uniref:Sortase n=1 Tax=Streptomyces sannanensis TaxID=285536 RepID=A0ABP6SA38_9ACTN